MKTYSLYICLLLSCFLFVSFFSSTTSPVYGGLYIGHDSAVFKLIGKLWGEGVLPYVELWDQKGPLIYVVDLVGYKMTGNESGIYLIQILFLFITSIFIYKSLRIVDYGKRSLLISIVIIGSLSINYEGGNLVEEYLLPFLAITYYYLLKYVIGGYKRKEPLFLFFFFSGLVMAICLFTRLTNALAVCSSELAIILFLLVDKRNTLVLSGLLLTSLGFVVVAAPILIYFYLNGAFDEMWYGMFEYNLEYATLNMQSSRSIFHFVGKYINCFVLLAVAFVCFIKKKWRHSILWSFTALVPLLWFVNSAQYAHYGMIVFPLLCVAYVIVISLSEEQSNKKEVSTFCCLLSLFMVLMLLFRTYQNWTVYPIKRTTEKPSKVSVLCKKYGIDKKSILLYNNSGADYLKEGLEPGMRFFFLHDFLIKNGPSIEVKMIESLKSSRVKWILVPGEIENKRIREMVKEKYRIVAKEEGYTIYNYQ